MKRLDPLVEDLFEEIEQNAMNRAILNDVNRQGFQIIFNIVEPYGFMAIPIKVETGGNDFLKSIISNFKD